MFRIRACVVGARRITSSTASVTRLHDVITIRSSSSCKNAKILIPSSSSLLTVQHQQHPDHHFISSGLINETNAIRSFSTDNNDDTNKDNNNKEGEGDNNQSSESSDASFFLDNDESKLNPPPSYVRDSITGKWTSETHAEISAEDKRLLKLDDSSKSEELMNRVDARWRNAAKEAEVAVGEEGDGGSSDFFGTLNKEHERVAHRIQEEQLAMGPIGRNPADSVKSSPGSADNEDESESSSTTYSKPLTPNEYQALKTYAKKEYDIQPKEFDKLSKDADGEDLIPIHDLSSGSEGLSDSKQFFDADLDLAYLNPRLSRRAFKDEGDQRDDPFADLLPSDLNPARKVNRKNAKPIPKRLLHHNNLSLLRRYTTPGGKIMNRVQSRLGAKDQRKIAKLVKRARHLGLIPHLGQWKYEDHGNLYEDGLQESVPSTTSAPGRGDESNDEGKRDWEIELEKRGLWPLQNETELIKRYYDMDKIVNHIAPTPKKRAELEGLLGGPGALVGGESNTELAEGGDKKQQE